MITWNNGPAWLRAVDLGLSLANVEPAPAAPAPQVIYQVVNQPAQAVPEAPQPAYQVDNQPLQVEGQPPAVQVVPAATPAPVMDTPTDVQKEWIRQELMIEHPEWYR